MRSNTRRMLWFVVAIGALAALWIGAQRWTVEAANRGVEIVLDWDEVRSLANETGSSVDRLLQSFYEAGARGMAVGEETIGSMQSLRRVEVMPPAAPARSAAPSAPGLPAEMTVRLRVPEENLRNRILNALRYKWDVATAPDDDVLTIPAAWPDVARLSLGFSPDVLTFIRAHHMEPIPRVTNFTNADGDTISWTADRLEAAGGRLIIFGGDQVLGYPDGLKDTSRAFATRSLLYGQVEFGKQKGEEALARSLRGNIVRVHSINPVEMARLSEGDAVARFLLAAEERGIRALYVRLLPGAPQPPIEKNVGYVNAIARSLVRSGYTLDYAKPYAAYESRVWERCLVGLGVGASTLLLASYVWPLAGTGLLLLLLLAAADVILPVIGLGRRLVALQGALLMPVLGFVWLREGLERRYGRQEVLDDDQTHRARLWRAVSSRGALSLFLGVTAVSLLGGLWVVGLLSSRMATVKITGFSGVKAQQAGALLMIAAIYFLDIDARGGLARARARVARRVQEIWRTPMLLGTVLTGVVALVILMMLLARSGNDPGIGVSPLELRFRALLDVLMGVRPRTKEFLVGHPALLLGIGLVALQRVRWALPLLLLGAIGQVSLVNTFSHLHTPLSVSVLRTVNGLVAGFLVAILAGAVSDRLRARWARTGLIAG